MLPLATTFVIVHILQNRFHKGLTGSIQGDGGTNGPTVGLHFQSHHSFQDTEEFYEPAGRNG